MFDYSRILSLEAVKKTGIAYNEGKFSFESYWEDGIDHYERLFYINSNGVSEPFTGILYELFSNGGLSYYSYYNSGYQEGESVEFFLNGNISKYTNFQKCLSKSLIIEWYENGQIKKKLELSDHSRHKKVIEYDESGSIIKQGEV